MKNPTIQSIQRDRLENAALVWARQQAASIEGEIVQLVLDETRATIPDLSFIQDAESKLERRLTAFVKNNLVEFTRAWTAELERVADASIKLAGDALRVTPAPPILVTRDEANK